ncbi:hypothetical protein PPYR_13731 [Photinus pyralis]|uniref:Methyltransferase domain-containing protein n=1 Tax=Photinus pyralis TaxID=7054 RepID=A0A5N4A9W1_PHOPY|nr:uncharacterized protein LOC116179134 [Photinus pyralis]KAB0794111.1 hypothetical protein PPYR_13731 [Photinus pyralis]
MARILNVTTADVGHNAFFTDYKLTWWDPNSWLRLLIQENYLALSYMKGVLRQKGFAKGEEGFRVSEGLRILDVGCGGGLITEPLARAGADILGIDINKDAIEIAEEHAKLDRCLRNIKYKWESIESHCLDNVEKYDVVILNFVLHHAKNHESLIRDCIKTLKPGGVIFLSSFAKSWESWFRYIFLVECIFQILPPNTIDWNKCINYEDVRQMANKYGCDVGDCKGIKYRPLSRCVQWSDSKNSMYIMHATKNK